MRAATPAAVKPQRSQIDMRHRSEGQDATDADAFLKVLAIALYGRSSGPSPLLVSSTVVKAVWALLDSDFVESDFKRLWC